MVRECVVKLNNKVVTVVIYDGIEIQLPFIGREADKIFVAHENGKYFAVDKNYRPKGASENDKKSTNKKTTIIESAKELNSNLEDDGNA